MSVTSDFGFKTSGNFNPAPRPGRVMRAFFESNVGVALEPANWAMINVGWDLMGH